MKDLLIIFLCIEAFLAAAAVAVYCMDGLCQRLIDLHRRKTGA